MRQIRLASPTIDLRDRRSVNKVLKSGNLAQGSVVSEFEENFSKVIEAENAIAVNSGTSGLLIGLIALGVSDGDEVIVPSFTFAASPNSIVLAGAKPIFVDIDPLTFCIDPIAIEEAITPKTKAIMPVHMYGHPANMNAIKQIARKYNLLIIEDAAQAHLAIYENQHIGTFGDISVFSFYPTKNMTSGEGGMIIAKDPEVARNCRLLRNQGMEIRYQNEVIGYNMRMTDIHAALGNSQLKKLENWTSRRRENAAYYLSNITGAQVKELPESSRHVYHQFTIRVIEKRDEYAEFMKRHGIDTGVYYPNPCHRLKSYNLDLSLPHTELASKEVISIPVHQNLKKRDLQLISSLTNEFLEGKEI
jgi:perosamine synthetase